MRVLAVVLLLAVTAFAASESSHESTHAQRAVSSMVSAALKGAAIKIKKNPAAAQPFHFTAVAGNHKIVLTSENYATLEGAQNGVESVLAHAGLRQNIKQVGSESAAGGKPYFKVQSDNGETIGVSETYSDASAAKKGADALHAIVVDITNSVAQSVPITPGKAGSSSSKGSSGKSGKSIAGKVRFGSGSVQPKKESTKKESGKKAKESSGKSSKKSVKAGHFEIKKTPAGFHYLIKGANQEIVASSEVYSSKDAVQKGVGAALRACGAKENLEVQKSEGAGFFVNCKAENNQKLFTTEIYTRASTGEDAIELLRGAIRATLHRYVKILPVTVAKSESGSSGASSARVSSAAKRESATSKLFKKF